MMVVRVGNIAIAILCGGWASHTAVLAITDSSVQFGAIAVLFAVIAALNIAQVVDR